MYPYFPPMLAVRFLCRSSSPTIDRDAATVFADTRANDVCECLSGELDAAGEKCSKSSRIRLFQERAPCVWFSVPPLSAVAYFRFRKR